MRRVKTLIQTEHVQNVGRKRQREGNIHGGNDMINSCGDCLFFCEIKGTNLGHCSFFGKDAMHFKMIVSASDTCDETFRDNSRWVMSGKTKAINKGVNYD